MKTNQLIQKALWLAASAFTFASCMSYKSIPATKNNPSQNPRLLAPGVVVKITKKSGTEIRMKVKEIDSLKISGIVLKYSNKQPLIDELVRMDDVKWIKVRRFSVAKTLALAFLLEGTVMVITQKPSLGSWDCCTSLNALQLKLRQPLIIHIAR